MMLDPLIVLRFREQKSFGMFQRCSPVVSTSDFRAKGVIAPYAEHVKADEWWVLWDKPHGTSHERLEHRVFEGLLALDLTCKTGRVHAVQHIARLHGRNIEFAFWHFRREMPYRARSEKRKFNKFTVGQLLTWASREEQHGLPVVPELEELDPEDTRKLSDGSFLVDALAIQAVASHLMRN